MPVPSEFQELPSYLLEPQDNRGVSCSCYECGMDLYKGETAWVDTEDCDICFCSEECAVYFYKENMIVKKTLE